MSASAPGAPVRGLRRMRWLGAATVAGVLLVNAAGIVGIALSRRAAREDARQHFELESGSRARELDRTLATTRADLAFLAGSPAFAALDLRRGGAEPDDQALRAVEGALLIFMRGHPEVESIVLYTGHGKPVVTASRRGGVPVVSLGSDAAQPLGREPLQGDRDRIRTLVTLADRREPERSGGRLQATVAARDLLETSAGDRESEMECVLRDGAGTLLAADSAEAGAAARSADTDSRITGSIPLDTGGWVSPSPWRLDCAESRDAALGFVAPLARTYRWTLGLNLAVMALAVGLGWFAVTQARRALELEASARESARVRELERQLNHSERLRTVGRLAAGIAHEINNPLAGMSNYLALAADALEAGDVEAARRRLREVRAGLEGAAGIVRRVLAHADPSSPPREPIDLREPLEQSWHWVRERREFDRIRFTLAGVDGLPPVRANRVQMRQVFLNLLLNACEVQPRGGGVDVRARVTGDAVEVTVADEGPGVPVEDRARIFEPFFSTKQSTGLGLSVCYGIVEEHGGALAVEESESGGALFRVSIPRESRGGAS